MPHDIRFRQSQFDLASQLAHLTDLEWGGLLTAASLGTLIGQRIVWGGKAEGVKPARAAYLADRQLVILIGGVRNPGQVSYVYAGSTVPRVRVDNASVSSSVAAVANFFATDILRAAPSGYESIVIAGHSYGGMVAQVLGVFFLGLAPVMPVQVFSTGSPRTGDKSLSAALGSATCVRLMNSNDPVPFFPPHFTEAPAGVFAAGWPAALYWSEYAQGPGGYVLHPNGDLRGAELPGLAVPIADTNLAGWLGASMTTGHPGHNLGTYVARLALGVPSAAPPVPTVSASLKGELAVDLPREIFNLGPVAGPAKFVEYLKMSSESVYLPPGYLPQGKRIQSATGVYWFGVQVAQTETFSNAKTIAKYLRRWLRYQQRAQVLDASTFDTAFKEYLAAASSPSSGFSPVLNVQY